MARLARKLMKIFGSNATTNQRSVIGSLSASAPAYTTDVETMQSLAQYLGGWYTTVVGANSPSIQDMNSLCYVFAYQLAYLFETGIPEWLATQTYWIGDIAQDGTGVLYTSLTDSNLNNALTDGVNWKRVGNPSYASITSNTVIGGAQEQAIIKVDTTAGAFNLTLPPVQLGFTFTVKDIGGSLHLNPVTIVRNASENIEGLGASYVCKASYGEWKFTCDGTNWWVIG